MKYAILEYKPFHSTSNFQCSCPTTNIASFVRLCLNLGPLVDLRLEIVRASFKRLEELKFVLEDTDNFTHEAQNYLTLHLNLLSIEASAQVCSQ